MAKIKCADCGWIGESKSNHDFVMHKCPVDGREIFVDGGNGKTCRYGGDLDKIKVWDGKRFKLSKGSDQAVLARVDISPIDMSAQLCYVRGNMAYFTTQLLWKQTGDDWEDKPYQCNAGPPYEPLESKKREWNKDGTPKWRIYTIFFDSGGDAYIRECCNIGDRYDRLSVDEINTQKYPWLAINDDVRIYAGTTVNDFIDILLGTGCAVYVKVEQK